ncbi:MAG: pyrroline-5-carboxylate reductase [Hyphomicrobiaceae bacterium]|nr:pyrroline-5-carboxylate reductase [Hyphomicrobiaceae bacterium]
MTIALPGPLVLAGIGKMGSALLSGLLEKGLDPAQVFVQDPAPTPAMSDQLARQGIAVSALVETLPAAPSVILAAVKPQVMDAVFPPLAQLAGPDTLILSIAAGRTIESFARHLPPGAAVIRSMPNTPAAIGRGITVCVANAAVTAEQRELAETLLSSVGEVTWLDDEALLDAVTAVSGSGPAYLFLLTQYLAEAGEAAGLPPELAQHLARSTMTGSAELMSQSDLTPWRLRENVTSPGGTTAAALDVLMAADGLGPLLAKAVAAAAARGRALSN